MTEHLGPPDENGPLASGWKQFHAKLDTTRLNAVEIEMVRLSYYFGARTAVLALAADRPHYSWRVVARELTRFDMEVMPNVRSESSRAAEQPAGNGTNATPKAHGAEPANLS